jgi:hypothetical protein
VAPISKEVIITYEIVRVEVQCFRKNLVIRGQSQIKRYANAGRDELWWPAGKGANVQRVAVDQFMLLEDATLIRVTPISDVADGLFNGDLAFRLTSESVHQVFGNSLERFVTRAWERYNAPGALPREDWRCYAFMTIYENTGDDVSVGSPAFRGYLPLDERLLTVAEFPAMTKEQYEREYLGTFDTKNEPLE